MFPPHDLGLFAITDLTSNSKLKRELGETKTTLVETLKSPDNRGSFRGQRLTLNCVITQVVAVERRRRLCQVLYAAALLRHAVRAADVPRAVAFARRSTSQPAAYPHRLATTRADVIVARSSLRTQ